MDDMARNVDRTVGKSPGIVRLSAIRGRQRAPLHGYAGKQTRSWRPKGSESRGTTGCCIRSKSSWFQAHPFREGNGRSTQWFMRHIAEQSAFRLDFARVDRDAWNEASATSSPRRDRAWIDPRPLIPLVDGATVEHDARPSRRGPGGPTSTLKRDPRPNTGPITGPFGAGSGGPRLS